MIRRLWWFTLGWLVGVASSAYVAVKMRRSIRRYRPERVVDTVREWGDELKAAVSEGRVAMHEREAEIRASTGNGRAAAPVSQPGA